MGAIWESQVGVLLDSGEAGEGGVSAGGGFAVAGARAGSGLFGGASGHCVCVCVLCAEEGSGHKKVGMNLFGEGSCKSWRIR